MGAEHPGQVAWLLNNNLEPYPVTLVCKSHGWRTWACADGLQFKTNGDDSAPTEREAVRRRFYSSVYIAHMLWTNDTQREKVINAIRVLARELDRIDSATPTPHPEERI